MMSPSRPGSAVVTLVLLVSANAGRAGVLLHAPDMPVWFAVCSAAQAVQREAITPPPAPDVAPFIGETYENDSDGNRLEDTLEAKATKAAAALQAAATSGARQEAQAVLNAAADIELIFNAPITQRQINDFLASGGEITYVYKAVSYGWNGRMPLGKISAIPQLMGASLVLAQEARAMVLHMDMATQTGRVRPVWASGFAGSPAGFDGDSSITIAIVDTGVDASHTDLAGRQTYWRDFTTDGLASPIDMIQHGSHVSGIALGTGAASGSGTSTLYYTDEGDLTGIPSGSFYPSPIGIPPVSVTFTSTAQWLGGGSTSLYGAYRPMGVSGSWTAISAPTTGATPITEVNSFTGTNARAYSNALLSNGAMASFVITNSVMNYPGVGDGFNKLRGVAPGCQWAAAKVFTNAGSGTNTWIGAAVDDLVVNRVSKSIKVMNLSLGTVGNPGIDSSERQKINTAVNNGIVVAVSAGNDGLGTSAGKREIDDPGRAAMAITVAASDDNNQLTDYTSIGFSSPGSTSGQEEDYKPDVTAPGGSGSYYTNILSVDSNSSDGSAFADQQPNDYFNIQGTSMASPFVAGCAALIIDALQQSGVVWDFASSQHSRYVKMVLCATASETNANRENGNYNPTLQRAAAGPSSFPAGKDSYEGYGLINPDAAVEAVSLTYAIGGTVSGTLGPGVTDRRVWARNVSLTSGMAFAPSLTVPAGGDFDLYLYSGVPSTYGTPAILASSTNAGSGVSEALSYVPVADTIGLLVVKRVSGSGAFSLTSAGDTTPPSVTSVTAGNPDGSYGSGVVVSVQVAFSEIVNVTGTPQLTLATTPVRVADYASGGGTSTLLFNYTVQPGDTAADLGYTSTMALGLNGGTLRDGAGNDAILTLPAPGAPGSLDYIKNIVVDTTAPVITACSTPQSSPPNGNCQGVVPSFTSAGSGLVASDDFTPVDSLVVTQNPSEGTTAGLGVTWVLITVADQAGNSNTCYTSFTVTAPLPPTDAQASPAAICPGGSSTLSALPGTGGGTVEWFTGACGGTFVGTGTSITVSPSSTTTYYARTTNTTAGCVGSDCATATVTVNANPAPVITASPGTRVCGTTITLDAGSGYGGYLWSPGGQTTRTIGVATTGTYGVTVTDGNGCQGSAGITVTVGAGVAPDFDHDCDVDLVDFTGFQDCFNGPNRPPAAICAVGADLDGDNDVDLADFGRFQACFNGPNRPPTAGC